MRTESALSSAAFRRFCRCAVFSSPRSRTPERRREASRPCAGRGQGAGRNASLRSDGLSRGRVAPSGADGRAVFDGVPEGKQRLAVEHIDYDAFRGNVDLAAGVRRPLGVRLNPVVWSKISGKVLEGAEQPLPGVRVSIAPKSVKATLQGPVEFMTGWDGAFVVSGLPPGVYKVELSHSGCAPKSFDLQVAPNMQEVSWSLAPLFDTASLTVTVRGTDRR